MGTQHQILPSKMWIPTLTIDMKADVSGYSRTMPKSISHKQHACKKMQLFLNVNRLEIVLKIDTLLYPVFFLCIIKASHCWRISRATYFEKCSFVFVLSVPHKQQCPNCGTDLAVVGIQNILSHIDFG
jgi:hypothetical protein